MTEDINKLWLWDCITRLKVIAEGAGRLRSSKEDVQPFFDLWVKEISSLNEKFQKKRSSSLLKPVSMSEINFTDIGIQIQSFAGILEAVLAEKNESERKMLWGSFCHCFNQFAEFLAGVKYE